MKPVTAELGSWMREARKRTGVSQDRLARRMKVTKTQVQNWESGRSEPGAGNLLRFCEVTGADVSTAPFVPVGDIPGLSNSPDDLLQPVA